MSTSWSACEVCGQVIHGEDQGLGEAAVLLLVFQGVLLDLLEDLPVGVRRRDFAFDLGRVELPLVLEQVELFACQSRVDDADLLALLQEDAVHADIGVDGDHVVVDEVALAHGPLVLVAVDDSLKYAVVCAAGVAVRPILMASKWSRVSAPDGQFRCRCSPGGTRRR